MTPGSYAIERATTASRLGAVVGAVLLAVLVALPFWGSSSDMRLLVEFLSMLTLAQVDEKDYRDTLQVSAWAGAGGALALLLASLGLYGVVSLAVRQRTREIGIRIAVGAEPLRVARMFLVSGVRASLVALALGLPLSIAALKIGLAQGLVIAPETHPYLIGVVIALVLMAVASAATWVPARRAALVDPARTLRVE